MTTGMTRPDLPITNATFGEWCEHYAKELMQWYRRSHGHGNPDIDEWAQFCLRQFDAQIMVEDDVINGRTM